MKMKLLTCLLLPLALCFLLSSCSKKEEGPSTYELTGDSAPSINNLLDGKGGVLSDSEIPDSSETDEADTQNYVYHYKELPDGGQTVASYVEALTASEIGFVIIDSSGRQTDAPDFSAEEGSLTLSRANFDLRKNLIMDLSWQKDTLTTTVHLSDATGAATGAASSDAVDPMTANDAVNFLKGLPTSVLGLPGDSMREYHVYYMDGKAIVDGVSCLRLRVYQISPPEGSNAILATYFLTPDKKSLYRLNPETNQLETMPLSS